MNCRNLLSNGIIIIALMITSTHINAQELKVKNVRFEDKGETIVIKYDLEGESKKKFKISLQLSADRGKTFEMNVKGLSGDIGRNVRPGTNKEIIWNLKKDYPFGLMGDDFVFGVTAESQKFSLWRSRYYIAGAGVLGGLIYLASNPKKPEVINTLTITIPAEY